MVKFGKQATETAAIQKALICGSLLSSLIAALGPITTHLRAKESFKTVVRDFGIDLALVFLSRFCHSGVLLLLCLITTEIKESVTMTAKAELELGMRIKAELQFIIQLIFK